MRKKYNWYQPKSVLEGLDFKNYIYIGKYKIIEDLLSKYLQKDDSLIDIGCNGGLVTLLSAKNKIKKSLGVDIDENNIITANNCLKIWKNKNIIDKECDIKFEQLNIVKKLDLLDNFNCIVMLRVLYHLDKNAFLFFEKIKSMKNTTIIVQCNERHQKHIDNNPKKYSGKFGKKLSIKKNCIKVFKEYGYNCIEKIEDGLGPEPILVFTNKSKDNDAKEKLLTISKEIFNIVSQDKDIKKSPGYRYIRTEKRIIKNINRHFEFYKNLNIKKKESILDIGTGCGFMLFFCKELMQCDVLGLDIPMKNIIYENFTSKMGIDIVKSKIAPYRDLPIEENRRFDKIVAFGTCFNYYTDENGSAIGCWGEEETLYFLKNINKHLNENGIIYFKFNSDSVNEKVLSFYSKFSDVKNNKSAYIKKEDLDNFIKKIEESE